MADLEAPGRFYLGRRYDPAERRADGEPLLYDARHLTTHAVCVGMTGSGKTGLGITLLEEAALEGIPSIVIDPKGDMGNLLLGFPKLAAADFLPWIDPDEAQREGLAPEVFAERVAARWRAGLAEWGQDGERIARLHDAVDMAVYTPGSTAGRPITVLRSFGAPAEAVRADAEALGDRVQSAVSGLLALIGVDADPIQSREAILVANLLQRAWSEGRGMELADLIREIQSPPFDRLGVLDVESFFPSKDRFALALALNNLLASPGFAPWLEGDPLEVGALLRSPEGKPRVSILSIAHLAESERMFFVTLLLNEVVAWMRGQPGTESLRAVVYMDEIFGYFPPTKEPPSKRPMLTLLKQARAYGIGVVLATQNPVDLDYKGLANTGTWFLGRLQTERDKLRVLDGLEGALSGGGQRFDRGRLDALLSGLGKRVFLLNDVHEAEPTVFQTRWALSYLRGPLTRQHLQALGAARAREDTPAPGARTPAPATPPVAGPEPAVAPPPPGAARPMLPDGVVELFEPPPAGVDPARVRYAPALLFDAKLHYSSASLNVEQWSNAALAVPLLPEAPQTLWDEASVLSAEERAALVSAAPAGARFAPAPAELSSPEAYAGWLRRAKACVYETCSLGVWKNAELKLLCAAGTSRSAAQDEVRRAAAERHEKELAGLRAKHERGLERLRERVRKAQGRLEVQEAQYAEHRRGTLVSIGSSLWKLLGGGRGSSAATSARRASRAAKEKEDVRRAEADLAVERRELAELEARCAAELARLADEQRARAWPLEEKVVHPRKGDLVVEAAAVLWRRDAAPTDPEA